MTLEGAQSRRKAALAVEQPDAPVPGRGLPRGAVLGSYTIHTLLGRGAMGEVYLASSPDSRVALKLLPPGARLDPRTVSRFEREQQAFFERVRQTYLDRAAAEPGRFRVIDASQGIEQVQAQIDAVLAPILAEGGA